MPGRVAVRGCADMEEERAKDFMHKFGYPRSQALLTILGSDKLSLDGPWLPKAPHAWRPDSGSASDTNPPYSLNLRPNLSITL